VPAVNPSNPLFARCLREETFKSATASLGLGARVSRSPQGSDPNRAAPGLCPELNPTEYIWGHVKHHELANRCAEHFADLETSARNPLRSMQRRPTSIRTFWHQAELPL
jgi:transposase